MQEARTDARELRFGDVQTPRMNGGRETVGLDTRYRRLLRAQLRNEAQSRYWFTDNRYPPAVVHFLRDVEQPGGAREVQDDAVDGHQGKRSKDPGQRASEVRYAHPIRP